MPVFTVSDPGIPPPLRGPVLIDAQGRPRYWPVVDSYLLHARLKAFDGSQPSPGYRAAVPVRRAALAAPDYDSTQSLARTWLASTTCCTPTSPTAGVRPTRPATNDEAWRHLACQLAGSGILRAPPGGGPARTPPPPLASFSTVFSSYFDHRWPTRSRRRRRGQPRGLPALVIEDLYELVARNSPATRCRNQALIDADWLLVLLLLRGPVAMTLLAVDAMKKTSVTGARGSSASG